MAHFVCSCGSIECMGNYWSKNHLLKIAKKSQEIHLKRRINNAYGKIRTALESGKICDFNILEMANIRDLNITLDSAIKCIKSVDQNYSAKWDYKFIIGKIDDQNKTIECKIIAVFKSDPGDKISNIYVDSDYVDYYLIY